MSSPFRAVLVRKHVRSQALDSLNMDYPAILKTHHEPSVEAGVRGL